MKKIQLFKIVCLTLILTTISCKKAEEATAESEKPAFDLTTEKASVEARYREFEKAFNAKDSVGLANCYTTDAKFMNPNAKAIEGKPAIQKTFGMWFKGESPTLKLNLIELWGDENNLTAEDAWTMTDKDGKVVDEGKSIEVYKKEDGTWKLFRDCYNSDLPTPK